jgi:hypothetical protein
MHPAWCVTGLISNTCATLFNDHGCGYPVFGQINPKLDGTKLSLKPALPTMQVEHRISVAAPPERIFAIYEDVQHWHTWDPDTKAASLDGPFRVGSRGKLTPTKGNAVPMLLTAVEPNHLFTVESKIPLFCMLFEHELLRRDALTEVIHRVTFSGLLSFILGPLIAKQLNIGLPRTLANLKYLAEGKSAV